MKPITDLIIDFIVFLISLILKLFEDFVIGLLFIISFVFQFVIVTVLHFCYCTWRDWIVDVINREESFFDSFMKIILKIKKEKEKEN